jgi:hypothetical protein
LIVAGCSTSSPKIIYDNDVTFYIDARDKNGGATTNQETAYNFLITLNPGWIPNSDRYRDYKNSKVSDVSYRMIHIIIPGRDRSIYAYLLEDLAGDTNGNVYRLAARQ